MHPGCYGGCYVGHESLQRHSAGVTQAPPPQKGQERQLKQCSSKTSDNGFSMTSASLSTESVYDEKECLVKSGKDKATDAGKIPL